MNSFKTSKLGHHNHGLKFLGATVFIHRERYSYYKQRKPWEFDLGPPGGDLRAKCVGGWMLTIELVTSKDLCSKQDLQELLGNGIEPLTVKKKLRLL